MKKYILLLLALSPVLIGTTSCNDFLSTQPTEIYSEDLVWGSQDMIDKFVAGTSRTVLGYYTDFRKWEKDYCNNYIHSGSTPAGCRDQLTNSSDVAGLNGRFGVIRNCNLIIEKCSASTVLDDNTKKSFIAQGKLLRAMIYYDFARQTGKFIWVDKVLSVDDKFDLPLTKSVEESYKYVLADIRAAIPDLPDFSSSSTLSKALGNALLSEVCLTAAAYTNNATSLQNGKSLYQEAVDAVDAIKGVSLTEDYDGMFNEKDPYSKEIIFAKYWLKGNTNVVNTQMQQLIGNFKNAGLENEGCNPVFSYDCIFECWCDCAPSQNLVDDYLVIDQTTGKAVRWDESSQWVNNTKKLTYSEAKAMNFYTKADSELTETSPAWKLTSNKDGDISDLMYEHRDARFAASILSDKDTFYGEPIVMRDKGNYGRYLKDIGCKGTTNYMPRKSIYQDCSPRPFWNVPTNYHLIAFRYGRALLNKAEALLQMNKFTEAVDVLNETRLKHGQLPGSEADNLEDAWTDYKRERRVDLVFEGDYYFSQLRWGMYGGAANDGKASKSSIAEFCKPGTFIDITYDRDACYVGWLMYQNNERTFNPNRGYLFPIPKSLINSNPAITDADQNPGWE